MYDSLTINLNDFKIENKEIEVFKIDVFYPTGEERITWKFKNFKIRQTGNGFNIFGSISKYFFGKPDLRTLTRQNAKEALQMLSDALKINIFESKIFRVDISCNLIMKEKIKKYFSILGDLKKFTKTPDRNTLYYHGNNKKLVFYDKYKELKSNNSILPQEIIQLKDHILRYEFRFSHQPAKQFRLRRLLVSDLCNEEIYNSAINIWEEHYFRINKNKKTIFNKEALISVKSFKNQLGRIGLDKFGYGEVMGIIEHSRKDFPSWKINRLMEAVEEIYNTELFVEPNELITELDEKIAQAAEMYMG